MVSHLALWRDEVILLVVLLQEEQDVREHHHDDRHAPVPRLLQHPVTLEHQLPGAGQHVRLLELPPHVHHGALGVDPLVDLQEPRLPLLLSHLGVDVLEYVPDESVGVPELLLLLGQVPGRLDERLDEQGVLGDPGGHEEDALGDALLLEQRVEGGGADELLEAAVALHDVLVERDGLVVLGAERAVGLLPGQSRVAFNWKRFNVKRYGFFAKE